MVAHVANVEGSREQLYEFLRIVRQDVVPAPLTGERLSDERDESFFLSDHLSLTAGSDFDEGKSLERVPTIALKRATYDLQGLKHRCVDALSVRRLDVPQLVLHLLLRLRLLGRHDPDHRLGEILRGSVGGRMQRFARERL